MPAQNKDLKTVGYVLRRTDYGEADRILNLITLQGKIAVIARGVRKMQSKLAGSIEPFTRSEFTIHQGHKELGILTSAKMQTFHGNIIQDLDRINLATKILRRINSATESTNSADYFQLVDTSFTAINDGENLSLIESWFLLNLKRVIGEEVNLYRDSTGRKLSADQTYRWDSYERAFIPVSDGNFGASEIKLLRLMVANQLPTIRKIKFNPKILSPIQELVQEL